MGKIYPLSERPSCFEATIKLIEKSFGYQRENSFEIDFAPLVDKSNHHNCFILVDENDNILAHIGSKNRIFNLGNESFTITMLGGIAVDEKHRGDGHFQTLLQDVMAEKRGETSLFLLWSDKEKLYNKFGFYLCGTQYELESEKKENNLFKTKYKDLSLSEKHDLQNLYKNSFARTYLTLERDSIDWKHIENIDSADLYLKKDEEKMTDYFFINKGQDLTGIIYEYGSINDLPGWLKTIAHFGKVWMGKPILETENVQYQFFMAPGDVRHFAALVAKLTEQKVLVRNVNTMKQEVYFDFNEELMGLNVDEFLCGLFGPGTFEELDLPSVFISGLESI